MINYREDIPVNPLRLRAWALEESNQSKRKSQSKLALALGVDRTTVSNWCKSGRDALQEKSIDAIAKYMDLPLKDAVKYLQSEFTETNQTSINTLTDESDRFSRLEATVSQLADRLDAALTMLEILGNELKQSKRQSRKAGTNARNDFEVRTAHTER